jgi:hypothetical protein
MMVENFLYKCTDCETVQAAMEDFGESTWVLACNSLRCQGIVKPFFRLDFLLNVGKGNKIQVICNKEVMGDDSEEDEIKKINEH